MSRRKRVKKRLPGPDPIYKSYLVSLLSLRVLKSGKKQLAERIVYKALEYVKQKTDLEGLITLEKAVQNISPIVELKPKRIGGATYQVPIEVKRLRATNLALKWLLKYSRERSGKNMSFKLARELMDASKGIGNSIRRREEVHRMAEANKAFSFFRSKK
ncbi:MAG: 30S ribosomal protein S7 [Flavobacterium sp.]|jgi:small subunit ribosomal protein S7|nr:30S ribosomal protein S7 [Flavobacterium sp.]